MSGIIGRLEALFASRGAGLYLGESVTLAEHMRQCAALARAERAADALVAAALLHDVGHLALVKVEDAPDANEDRRHEAVASELLAGAFPPEVVEPVRLHVAAKRYLCAANPAYLSRLSEASRQSLTLQGGPMSPDDAAAFREAPHAQGAIRVRLWDDAAKVAGAPSPDFAEFRPLLESLIAV